MPSVPSDPATIAKNLFAFWILGLCNNFAYVIMLSAAKDILDTEKRVPVNRTANDHCEPFRSRGDCSQLSTGSVLLADILPGMIVKIVAPFLLHRFPFGVRHLAVVFLQAASFIVVASSGTIFVGLSGVVLASVGSAMGEVTYLSLASFFSSDVVAMWSSGTGGAGVLGSFAYAALTDANLLALSPRGALHCMLIIPFFFALVYWYVLVLPVSVHRVVLSRPSTYVVASSPSRRRRQRYDAGSDDEGSNLIEREDEPVDGLWAAISGKLAAAKPLCRFMVPLSLVYFAEYFINQGLLELLVFDCAHGFQMNKSSQYRWYQVLYQIGVFISRSSVDCFTISPSVLPLLPILQLMNAALLFWDTMQEFLPHIAIVCGIVFYEGLLGGAAYVNTFSCIHKTVTASKREFSMGFASMADTFGIVCAGFLAIPAHNFICNTRLSFPGL